MQDRKRDTDIKNSLLDSVGDGKDEMIWEGNTETCILSSVKQITSPGWMHETSAQGWSTGKSQRDGMGREWEGGSGWGTHVNPWLIHVNVWQTPLQYCKIISLQLIKINGKKKVESKKKKKQPYPPLHSNNFLFTYFTFIIVFITHWPDIIYWFSGFPSCVLEDKLHEGRTTGYLLCFLSSI